MKYRITAVGELVVKKLLASLKRFPETIMLAFSVVCVLIYMNHFGPDLSTDTSDMLMRITMTLALGIPVSLCLVTLFERIPSTRVTAKALTYAGAAMGLLMYGIFLLQDFEMVPVTRYIAINMALYLAFTFIPNYKKENYELYVIKLFTGFFVTYLYSAVLFIGLVAMLFTVNSLFSLDLSSNLYFDIWLIVAGVFAPAYFLADIPAKWEEMQPGGYLKVLKVLLLYIVMPLIIAYSAILYVYFAKILITRQWPDGMVSHLVLWYSMISIFVLFLVYPVQNSNQWVRSFTSYLPKFIIPLLAMMFVAMGIRINAYGVTENRYFVMAAGIWVTCSMLYYAASKNIRNIRLPVLLAAISVLSVTGPWSAYSVSKYSQNTRFEDILERHGMIRDGDIVKAPDNLPDEAKEDICSIIRYFDRYHDLEQLRYLPKGFTQKQMEPLFGFEYGYDLGHWDNRDYFYYDTAVGDMLLEIGEYDYFAGFGMFQHRETFSFAGPLSIEYLAENRELVISKDDQTIYKANLPEIVSSLHQDLDYQNPTAASQMTYTDQNDSIRVLYFFKRINGWEDKSSAKIEIDRMEFCLFIELI